MCWEPCNSPRIRALASRFSPSRFRKSVLWNYKILYGFHYPWIWIPKIRGHSEQFSVISEHGVKTRVPSVLLYHGTFGTDSTRVFSPYSFFHCHVHTSILYWTEATASAAVSVLLWLCQIFEKPLQSSDRPKWKNLTLSHMDARIIVFMAWSCLIHATEYSIVKMQFFPFT